MPIGLSTYAFFWQWQRGGPVGDAEPITLTAMLEQTSELGLSHFQICDYPPLLHLTDVELDALHQQARALGITLELGTRGVGSEQLSRFLRLAERLDVALVRSMINSGDHRPSRDEAVALLRAALPAYERAGVTLALETYEQVPTDTLVQIVRAVDSPRLGICLDPGNCVAALEHPLDVITATAPWVRNVHVKDFAFSRRDGWVGFTLAGCPLGEGQLPLAALLEAARAGDDAHPATELSLIVEHWLPWQDDRATTVATEDRWTAHTVDHLRSQL